MPLLPLLPGARAARQFADLLDGAGAPTADPQLRALADLAGRLSSLPPPPLPGSLGAAGRTVVLERVQPPGSDGAGPAGPTGPTSGPGGPGSGGSGTGGPGGVRPPAPPRPGTGGAGAGGSGATGATATTAVPFSSVTGSAPGGLVPGLAPLGPALLHLVAAATAAAIATTGVLAGTAAAGPGQLLYPAKQGLESLRVELATDRTAQASAYLDQARTRLDELDRLLARPGALGPAAQRQAAELLAGWAAATRPAIALLPPLDPTLVRFVDDARSRLGALRSRLPAGALQSSLTAGTALLASATVSQPVTPAVPSPLGPGVRPSLAPRPAARATPSPGPGPASIAPLAPLTVPRTPAPSGLGSAPVHLPQPTSVPAPPRVVTPSLPVELPVQVPLRPAGTSRSPLPLPGVPTLP